jgi:hypothetical protein
MSVVVLPRIDVDNPFGAIMHTLANDVMPFVQALVINKEKIALLSNAELPDYVPVLKQYAPDLLTQNGKIDWTKVNEYATSGDIFKQKIAHIVSTAKKFREEYAKQPIIVKLNKISEVATATDPTILQKYGSSYQALQKFKTIINNTNLPDEIKYNFLLNADKFIEKPEYIELLDNLLSDKKKQETTQQGGGTSSWKFSLDGVKRFGIKLEEPQLTPLQVSPLQVPKVVAPQSTSSQTPKVSKQKTVVKQKQGDSIGKEKQPTTFWRDGVLWEMRRGKDGKVEYIPREAPLVEQDIDPLTGLLSYVGGFISKVFGKGASKVVGRGAQKGAEKVAKETVENVASKQAKSEAENVVGQKSKYDKRREEVKMRIDEQLRKKEPADAWEFVYEKPPVEKKFEVVSIKDLKEKARQKRLPVLAPKETRWEFANAKPPAVIYREKGKIVDYVPPQFERLSATKLNELIRQKKLPRPPFEGERTKSIKLPPKETPYKEEVAKQGYKTSQKLEEFLKNLGAKSKTEKAKTKEAVLNPIKKLENLIKEIPDEARQDLEIRKRFVEVIRDLKKISKEAPFRDVSEDLRTLDTKVEALRTLLKKQYGKVKNSKEKPTQKTKKKKSDQ